MEFDLVDDIATWLIGGATAALALFTYYVYRSTQNAASKNELLLNQNIRTSTYQSLVQGIMGLEQELLRDPSHLTVFGPYAYPPIYRPGRIRETNGKEIDRVIMTCVIAIDYFHLLHSQKIANSLSPIIWGQWASHYLILLRDGTYLRQVWDLVKNDYNNEFVNEIDQLIYLANYIPKSSEEKDPIEYQEASVREFMDKARKAIGILSVVPPLPPEEEQFKRDFEQEMAMYKGKSPSTP